MKGKRMPVIKEKQSVEQEIESLRSSLRITRSDTSMYLIAVAIHEDRDKNTKIKISTCKGMPLGGIVHDALRECLYVMGIDSFNVGAVPISFAISIDDCPHWSAQVAVPNELIDKYLSERQRHELRSWKQNYPKCKIVFLQLLHHNS